MVSRDSVYRVAIHALKHLPALLSAVDTAQAPGGDEHEGESQLIQRENQLDSAIRTVQIALDAFGWGENADRLITNKAVDTLPSAMERPTCLWLRKMS
jgi:hypothetical protein